MGKTTAMTIGQMVNRLTALMREQADLYAEQGRLLEEMAELRVERALLLAARPSVQESATAE